MKNNKSLNDAMTISYGERGCATVVHTAEWTGHSDMDSTHRLVRGQGSLIACQGSQIQM